MKTLVTKVFKELLSLTESIPSGFKGLFAKADGLWLKRSDNTSVRLYTTEDTVEKAKVLSNPAYYSPDLNALNFQGGFSAYPVTQSSVNLFPTNSNANAVITIDALPNGGNLYYHQLGFSSEGRIFHRFNHFTGPTSWREIYHSGNLAFQMSLNYLPKWDGTKFVNSAMYESNNLLFGSIALSPNLIHNSWMNRISSYGRPDGFNPAIPQAGATLTVTAVHPYTKGFEGCYAAAFNASIMTNNPEIATENLPMWYASYNLGDRSSIGGLATGWGTTQGGNILKMLGSGFTQMGTTNQMKSFFTVRADYNQIGSRWIFSCWIKIVKGIKFAVGNDAGYYGNGYWPNSVTKTVTDTASQGWYNHRVLLSTSQISSIAEQIMGFAIEPDVNGEIEAYIALPYLAVATTKGINNNSWSDSIIDRLYRYGFKMNLNTLGIIYDGTIASNESINFNAVIDPTQTGTPITKTSTWMWQYLTQGVNWLKANFANYALATHTHAVEHAELFKDFAFATVSLTTTAQVVKWDGSIDSSSNINVDSNGSVSFTILSEGIYLINYSLSFLDKNSNGVIRAFAKIENSTGVVGGRSVSSVVSGSGQFATLSGSVTCFVEYGAGISVFIEGTSNFDAYLCSGSFTITKTAD